MYGSLYYGESPPGGYTSLVPYTYIPLTGARKNLDSWTNNDIKSLNSWVTVAKNPTLFKPELNPGPPYLYDSATIPYDSGMFYLYDLAVNGNQINQLTSTQWTEKYV